MNGVAIGGCFTKLGNGLVGQLLRDHVDSVIVIAEFREVALRLKFGDEAMVVANRRDFCVFDGAERVGDHRKSRNTECHETLDKGVMQTHLYLLVGIFVMHVVNDVHGVDVQLCQPRKINIKARNKGVIVERVALKNRHLRTDM